MEPEVKLRTPCEQCKGKRRIPSTPPAGGMRMAPGSETEPCPACDGYGYSSENWVPLGDLRRLLGVR